MAARSRAGNVIRTARGLSILEVLVAVLLVGVGALAAANLQLQTHLVWQGLAQASGANRVSAEFYERTLGFQRGGSVPRPLPAFLAGDLGPTVEAGPSCIRRLCTEAEWADFEVRYLDCRTGKEATLGICSDLKQAFGAELERDQLSDWVSLRERAVRIRVRPELSLEIDWSDRDGSVKTIRWPG